MTSVTYLQQTDASWLRPARRADLRISRVFPVEPAFNSQMYREIGADWKWTDFNSQMYREIGANWK